MGHTGLICSINMYPSGMPKWLINWIFSFHMPLFFILSGYFFKPSKIFDGKFYKKEFVSLVLPYIITATFVIIGASVVAYYMPDMVWENELFKWLGAALYGEGAETPLSLVPVYRIGAIWFLLALMWSHVIINLCHRFMKHPSVGILCSFVIGWWLSSYVWLPLSIQAGMCCVLFVYAGCKFREKGLFEDGYFSPFAWVLLGIVWALSWNINGESISLAMNIYPQGLLSIVGGIAGSMFFIALSKAIERHIELISRFLQWIGRNTLVIFCMHLIEDNVIRYDLVLGGIQNAMGDVSWVLVFLFRMIVIIVLCSIVYIIPGLNKVYFPQKRKKKIKEKQSSVDENNKTDVTVPLPVVKPSTVLYQYGQSNGQRPQQSQLMCSQELKIHIDKDIETTTSTKKEIPTITTKPKLQSLDPKYKQRDVIHIQVNNENSQYWLRKQRKDMDLGQNMAMEYKKNPQTNSSEKNDN